MKGRRDRRIGRRLTVTLSPNRQVVIPKQLCEALDLRAGDLLEGSLEAGRVVFTPQALVDRRLTNALEGVSSEGRLSQALRAALRRS